ncbi:MAG: hypothetical protein ACXWQQ_16060 [Pseudobdellovibrio sp.]
MTRETLWGINGRLVRDKLNLAVEVADELHKAENDLVRILLEIDRNKFYIRVGFKSLSGFCHHALHLSETQAQRIVTRVRRYEPTPNLGKHAEEGIGTAAEVSN